MRFALSLALFLLASEAWARPFPAAGLPRRGNGYLIPETWAQRGLRFGRPELVGMIQRAAQRVAREWPGALLYVGDLSLRNGARTPWHASHRRGLDADLMFYAVDEDGLPAEPPRAMPVYDHRGETVLPDGRVLRFDVARNWELVKALLRDRDAQVVKIFVATPLRAQLILYAIGNDEPRTLISRAAQILEQPADSLPHDDHFHVRIAGPVEPPRVAARAGKPPKAVRGKPQQLQRHATKRR